jgi:hypothetical protein
MDRVVVITSRSGEKLIGTLPPTLPADATRDINRVVTPEVYLEECVARKLPVELTEVRVVVIERNVKMTEPTEANPVSVYLGTDTFIFLLPVEMAKGPTPKVYVIPAAWYFPKDKDELATGFAELMKQAKDAEVRASASEVLELPAENGRFKRR